MYIASFLFLALTAGHWHPAQPCRGPARLDVGPARRRQSGS